MKLDSLEGLKDDELQQVVARANELLDARKQQKRHEAIEQARAALAAAGLTVDDLRRSSKKSGKKAGPTYSTGGRYQHPDNPSQVWAGKGKKPHWLRDLEKKGGKPVELK
jgi:DNA-binding protein H-NS